MGKRGIVLKMVLVMFCLIGVSFATNVYLISDISKSYTYQGEVIKVYGYVEDNYIKYDLPVKVYLNGELIGTLKTDKKGYFETYIKMDDVGINIIRIRYKTYMKEFRVLVYKKPPVVEIRDSSYYTVVISDGKNGSSTMDIAKNIKNQYVDVEVSAKELPIGRFEGSTLKVIIYNHLNTTKAFVVDVDGIDDKDYYSSGTLELKPLERGEITLYIRPLNLTEEKEITLHIKTKDKEIAKKSVVLMPIKKQRMFKFRNAFIDLSSTGIVSLFFIVTGFMFILGGIYMLDKGLSFSIFHKRI